MRLVGAAVLSGLVLAGATMVATPSQAVCECVCINGVEQSVCTSSIDIPALCGVRLCPMAPPALSPLDPPVVPPVGTSHCQSEQVYNEYTRRYEWQMVCR